MRIVLIMDRRDQGKEIVDLESEEREFLSGDESDEDSYSDGGDDSSDEEDNSGGSFQDYRNAGGKRRGDIQGERRRIGG